jgi:hypothetical protein
MKPCAVAPTIACPQAAKSQSKVASNRVNLLIRFNQSLATVSVCFVHNPRKLELPDNLGAPTIFGIVLACIQYPI